MFRLKRTPVFLFLVFLSALSHAQSTQLLSLFQTFTGVDYIKTSTGQIPPPFDIVGIKLLQLRLDRQPELLHLYPQYQLPGLNQRNSARYPKKPGFQPRQRWSRTSMKENYAKWSQDALTS